VDIHRLAAAGVEEVFFDLNNNVTGPDNLQAQLDIAGRLREICQSAISSPRSDVNIPG